jgi:hypothetical protein
VYATNVEFRTDAPDNPGPYALMPVFNEFIQRYTVVVPGTTEKVYPLGYPETGSTISFGPGPYGLAPDGAYAFPLDKTELDISFTVTKQFRNPTDYFVRILRDSPAGKLLDLRVSVAYWKGGPTPSADPSDPDWVYENDNYLLNFDANNFDYTAAPLKIPYYAQKILFTPNTGSQTDVQASYKVQPRNPAYYTLNRETPAETAHRVMIDYSASHPNPGAPGDWETYYNRYFDGANYVNDQLRIPNPMPDTGTGKKVSYLTVKTSTPGTPEREYKILLQWDNSYAYLKDLKVTDDTDSFAANRFQGTFNMTNQAGEARTASAASQIKIEALPRDSGSVITKIVQYTEDGLTELDRVNNPSGPPTFSFPGTMQKCLAAVTVRNPSLTPNDGEITYWIDVIRDEPFTRLVNLKLEGFDSDPGVNNWVTLYWYDKRVVSPGDPEPGTPPAPGDTIHDSSLLTLTSPSSGFDPLPGQTNYTMEIDGVRITKLRLTGYPEPGGTVKYQEGNTPFTAPRTSLEFDFSGGGAAINASLSNHKDRLYGFTFIRAGANAIELLTDIRDPDSPNYTNPAFPPADNEKEANNSGRGDFQAFAGTPPNYNRPVSSAIPGQTVTIRVKPHLGWQVSLPLASTGALVDEDTGSPVTLNPTVNPNEWTFTMPARKVTLRLRYDFVTEKLSRTAYVAPAGRAAYSGNYGDPVPDIPGTPAKMGTCWAYATSNLQGVINGFVEGGGPFDEIWLHEGTYTLDPNGAAALDWADEISAGDRSDERNRAFVLKRGLRLYGGFKGTEGTNGSTVTTLAAARALRDSSPAAALRTILSGLLRNSAAVHHVVIASNITAPASQSPAARSNLDTQAAYNFVPDFDASDVTLLDTLSIRNGSASSDTASITVRSGTVSKNWGAGLYNVDASPYLRNVQFMNNTAVQGGGIYSGGAGTSAPVLSAVVFNSNRAAGYGSQGGGGGGMAVSGGMPFILDSEFKNNTVVAGSGAGLYGGGGNILVKGSRFFNNTANSGGAISNSAGTWVYQSEIYSNDAYDSGSGIQQGGTLHLVNTSLYRNRQSSAISNTGTLSGTNVRLYENQGAAIDNVNRLVLTNSRIYKNPSGINSARGVTALANVVIDENTGTGFNFNVTVGDKDPTGTIPLGGAVLTNVTFHNNGTGINAHYSSGYSFHHGAANLVLNSVRISGNGDGINLSQSSGDHADGLKGLYVTINNATIAGNGSGIHTAANNRDLILDKDDALVLRIRNSVIVGNNSVNNLFNRRVAGNLGAGTLGPAGALNLSKEKAALFAPGDTFRIAAGGPAGAFKAPVFTVTRKTHMAGTPDYIELAYTGSSEAAYAAADYLALSGYDAPIATAAVKGGGSQSAGDSKTIALQNEPSAAEKNLLRAGAVFRFDTADIKPNTLTANVYEVLNSFPLGWTGSTTTYALIADLPLTGSPGDAYLVLETGSIHAWNNVLGQWDDTGVDPRIDEWRLNYNAGSDVSAAGSWSAGDTITVAADIPLTGVYARLPGQASWLKSLAEGAGMAPSADAAGVPNGWGALISVVPALNAGNYYRVPLSSPYNTGDSGAYPANAAALLNQCFGPFEGRSGTAATAAIRADMDELFDTGHKLLMTWESGDPNPLTMRDITYFLDKHNGFNRGDLQTPYTVGEQYSAGPRNGGTVIGAYQN